MKAIILAAGEGTRMRPITLEIPKSLIKINGKALLEYTLECIYKDVDEIIIVVKYLQEQIKEYFGDNFKGTKISYQKQGEMKGTGGAVMGIDFDDDVLILNGDSIFYKDDIDLLINMEGYGCLVKEVRDPKKYGIFEHDDMLRAARVVEKPKLNIGNLANIGVYKFSSEIFEFIRKIEKSERGEYEITCAINLFIKDNEFTLHIIGNDFIDVGCPEDIEKAEKILNSKK